jgi:hypothetical protein
MLGGAYDIYSLLDEEELLLLELDEEELLLLELDEEELLLFELDALKLGNNSEIHYSSSLYCFLNTKQNFFFSSILIL